MRTPLPESLQPTADDVARDAELAREAQSILDEVQKSSGLGVKWNSESYNSVTFGADGSVVSRVVNGVPQQTPEQEAVSAAQASANADIKRLEREIERLTSLRDEITGFDPDGSPRYVRCEETRRALDKDIRSVRFTLIGQQRLNERRWRHEAAPAVHRAEANRNYAAQLARELEAQGRVQRVSGW
ncbi:hypothetical protein [Sphingopyxis sp. P8]|uniref:hypothetical protein n=1 Tax=Sphingopyxis sp. P8 TaxID=2763256 RepID=UPI001D09D043|nr:hypothetical protein [Sphingopyxis sp. P8]